MKTKTVRTNYKELARRVGDAVLNNNIISKVDDFYLESGTDYNEEEDYYYDIFQYYIITASGADYLSRMTEEIVYYSESLDMYLWGITHYGTPWEGVEVDILEYDFD